MFENNEGPTEIHTIITLELNELSIVFLPIVDGGWAVWSTWSPCPVTCGGSNHTKTRTCTNPSPGYGGSYCLGDDFDTHSCNTQPCPSK